MSSENNISAATWNSDLLPQKSRTLGPFSYTMSWIGAVININSFMMGAALVPPTGVLNLVQAVVAMLVGVGIILVLMTLNGEPGHKYGIPFIMQARTSFGGKGALMPGLIRAIPCVLWYGIQTWIGAEAVNTVFRVLFNFDNIWVCFIGFLIIQIVLSSLGFKGIKWIENFGAAFIIVALSIMFFVIYSTFKSDIITNLIQYKGSWGFPLIIGIATFGGTYATYVVTMGDIIREMDQKVKLGTSFWLHLIGCLPFTMFMAVIGLLCSGVTGTWDPISVFAEILPNKPLLVMTLMFIAFAQITTNVLINVVPCSYVIMQYTPLKYKPSCLVIGLLAGLCLPWKLTTSTGFTSFVQILSAFLIPSGLVLITDYWYMRKRTLDLNTLYDPKGPFTGVNWNGIIAITVGAVFGLIFKDISWMAGFIPTILTYILLSKYGPFSREFRVGTIFEKK